VDRVPALDHDEWVYQVPHDEAILLVFDVGHAAGARRLAASTADGAIRPRLELSRLPRGGVELLMLSLSPLPNP